VLVHCTITPSRDDYVEAGIRKYGDIILISSPSHYRSGKSASRTN
jgi:hypothetical protein